MQDMTSYLYYRLIYKFLSKKIETFGFEMMGNLGRWVSSFALLFVTLWILIEGYRTLTGQSRESLMSKVLHLGRIAVIVSFASTVSFAGSNLHTLLTVTLDKQVHAFFTGDGSEGTADAIDRSLGWTQLAIGAINAVQVVPGDYESQGARARAELLAAFGTASPPMTAGAMLLLYKFAMALFIGLGPLFILCLIFDQTKHLFKRWLMYGLGTTFSMALLSVVSSMVLELMIAANEAIWGAKIANKLLGTDTEGLSALALQQGGIGLLLTTLIISVPPMAAMFFQGTLGSFSSYSVFSGGDSHRESQAYRHAASSQHPLPTGQVDPQIKNLTNGAFVPRMNSQTPQRDEIKRF